MTTQKTLVGKLVACLVFCGFGLPPALQAEDYVLAAGASDTLTSETAVTTNYDSMSIAGSLTVSGMMTVQSTGTVTVAGGTVTVSGDTASIGKQGKNSGSNWNIASEGKIVINNGKPDFSVGADGFAILDSCEGQDGYIDFMEINGGGFCPWYMDNNAAATARIKVSGTAILRKATGPSYGSGLFRKGAFEVLLQDQAQLTFEVSNQQGSLNVASIPVDIVGSGDVTFRMSQNNSGYPCSLRTGAKLNNAGSVTFSSGNAKTATFSLTGDDIFGANVTNVSVAASDGGVTLEIAGGTTQTVRRLSFLREGKDDVLAGAGTLYINAIAPGAVFEARLATNAALTVVKTGTYPVTASGTTNYPALNILSGSFKITNDCFVANLSGAPGATLIADGCTVSIAGGDYALGGLELATANGGSFVKTGSGTAYLYAPGALGAKLHVAEGNAVFSAIGLSQRYWRFTFKEMSGGTPAPVVLRGIYLFGTTGAWENSGMSVSSPAVVTETNSSALAANKVRYFVNSATNVVADTSKTKFYISKLSSLFSTSDDSNTRPALLSPRVDSSNQDSWLSIEFRLNAGGNPITGYNLCNGTGNLAAYPSSWSVFASDDGNSNSWTEIDSRSGETCNTGSGKNYTYDGGADYVANIRGKTVAELPSVVTEHFKFSHYKGDGLEADAAKAISVQVDAGASLDLTAFTVAPQKIGAIAIDLAKGGGTIHGGSIAATGALEIATAGAMNYGQPLPVVFDGASDTTNFTNWTVRVNGAAVNRKLVFQDGALAFERRGVIIIVE